MAEEIREKERELSIPEYFMLGAKKGFYITVELIAPAMVMAYTLSWGSLAFLARLRWYF